MYHTTLYTKSPHSFAELNTAKLGPIPPPGHIFAICGPSGAGRTTVINALLDDEQVSDEFKLTTVPKLSTRPLRKGEPKSNWIGFSDVKNGREKGQFFYSLFVYNNWHVCQQRDVLKALIQGKNILIDMPPLLVLTLQKILPRLATGIMIVPTDPNTHDMTEQLAVLHNRRQKRSEKDTTENLRNEAAAFDLSLVDEFEHVVINEDGELETTLQDLKKIIREEIAQNEKHNPFIIGKNLLFYKESK